MALLVAVCQSNGTAAAPTHSVSLLNRVHSLNMTLQGVVNRRHFNQYFSIEHMPVCIYSSLRHVQKSGNDTMYPRTSPCLHKLFYPFLKLQ